MKKKVLQKRQIYSRCRFQIGILNGKQTAVANAQAQTHTFHTTSPFPSSSSIFHSAIHGWSRLLKVIKNKISRIENPFRRCCKLSFCHAPRLETVHPASSRWQHQAKVCLTLIGYLLDYQMGDTSGAFFSPICLYRNLASCLRSNLSTTPKQPVFIPRISPCRHSVLMRSPHHTLCVCSNPVKTARHGKPHLTVCPALPLPNWVDRPWRLEIWIFNANKWKKACLLCFPHKNGAKCDLFVEKMRAMKVNMHQCLFFFCCFFFGAFGAEIECFAALNYCWLRSQEFLAFLTWISRGRSSALRIPRAALDLCLGFLACPGWTTLCKGRHWLHPLKRSGGG